MKTLSLNFIVLFVFLLACHKKNNQPIVTPFIWVSVPANTVSADFSYKFGIANNQTVNCGQGDLLSIDSDSLPQLIQITASPVTLSTAISKNTVLYISGTTGTYSLTLQYGYSQNGTITLLGTHVLTVNNGAQFIDGLSIQGIIDLN